MQPNGNPAERSDDRPRVGLVLGGGGILGAAWLIGALHVLAEESGWAPGSADHIVGTSAGSAVGALVANGIPPWFLVHHQRGGSTEGMTDRFGEPLETADEGSARFFEWTRQVPRLVLGSPSLALRTAIRPWRFPPTAALVGWIGRGFLSTDEIGRVVRTAVRDGWGDHQALWIVAIDYANGRRVVFGSPEAPRTDLWRAVEASCSIPGFYRPVRIDGRDYVDGGAWSASNLDLLARERLDVVIALNPMSSLHPGVPTTLLERLERRVRSLSGRRLGYEARKVRESGAEVLLIQPGEEDLHAMGVNLMNASRRRQVIDAAILSTRARLREPDAKDVLRLLHAPAPH